MDFLHMPKELSGLSDQYYYIDSQQGREQSSHACVGIKTEHAVKEAWEGQGPAEWRCGLARGVEALVCYIMEGVR